MYWNILLLGNVIAIEIGRLVTTRSDGFEMYAVCGDLRRPMLRVKQSVSRVLRIAYISLLLFIGSL